MRLRRTALDPALALFVASAAWGWMVAYDRRSATVKLAWVGLGVLVHYVVRLIPSHVEYRGRDIPLLRSVAAGAPALLAAHFLLTNDWSQPVEKVAWLDPIRSALATVRIAPGAPSLHPNVVGGVLAALIPLQAAGLVPRRFLQRGGSIRQLLSWGIAPLGVSLFALVLTGLRGAWLALALAAGAWGWWRMCAMALGARRGRRAWAAGVLSATVALGWAAWRGAGASFRPDRILVWGNAWGLARDYAVTGLGLGCFTMPYSSYALLVHVPHTTHAHNLLLDIWLEQGLLGLLAFLWIVIAAVVIQRRRGPVPGADAPGLRRNESNHQRLRAATTHPNGNARRWRAAALIALGVVLLHGMIDDTYYGYGGAGAAFLFVPFAFLARVGHARRPALGNARARRPRLVAATVAVSVGLVVLAWPPSRATLHASWGALLQTRAEMAVYSWPRWPVQDAVRRSGAVDLSPAETHYRAALALDPSNAVANRRLAQIELSMGAYDVARRRLLSAYAASPGHRATRLMLGESLAISGDPAAAAALWRTLVLDVDQLAIRRFWYESIGDDTRAGLMAQAMALTAGERR